MKDKFDKTLDGPAFYRQQGLIRKGAFAKSSTWKRYERAANRKGWKLRKYLTWFLENKAPK